MVIKELSEETMNDWFDYFDNDAFKDHEDWKGCYCTAFYSPRPVEYDSTNRKRRDYAKWLIEKGRMKGYLAYEEGKVVGWVNVNEKSKFPRLEGLMRDNEKVLSIVCFLIKKEFRRKGIAKEMLKKIIEAGKNSGYSYVEAYPKKRAKTEYNIWNGPYELYIKSGFVDCKVNNVNVVRLDLTNIDASCGK